MSALNQFGPFASVFGGGDLPVPGYLPLLGLFGEDALAALRRVRAIVDGGDGVSEGIEALLSGSNWRPHLVGAVATLMVVEPQPFMPSLWSCVDSGSWVSPQLAITLSLTDPSFDARARGRVGGESPAGPVPRSPKTVVSLLTLLRLGSRNSGWLSEHEDSPDIKELLDRDRSWDNSARIVERWRSCLMEIVQREPGLFAAVGARA